MQGCFDNNHFHQSSQGLHQKTHQDYICSEGYSADNYYARDNPILLGQKCSLELWGLRLLPWRQQDLLDVEDQVSENAYPDIGNIVGTSKITRSGRVFSPDISPPKVVTSPMIIPTFILADTTIPIPVNTPVATPITESAENRGKDVLIEHVQTKARSESIRGFREGNGRNF